MNLDNWMIVRLGSGPLDELLATGQSDGYFRRSRFECWQWKEQLERLLAIPVELRHCARYGAESFEREDGYCLEIVFKSHEDSPTAQAFVEHVLANLPKTWDELAKQKLAGKFAQAGLPIPVFAEISV
jgi:hypothetical protein